MSYIGKNIKRIRAVKKLSQAQFAELFNLARPSVGAYEEGRSEPKIDTIIAIAQHFGISADALLRKELSVNELYSFDIFKGDFDPTSLPPALGKSSKNEQIQFQPKPTNYTQGIPLIKKGDRTEYLINLKNKDFITRLTHLHVPTLEGDKFRAFEHVGTEMLTESGGLHESDILACTPTDLDKVRRFEPGKLLVIVSAKQILTRRFEGTSTTHLLLLTDRPTDVNTQLLLEEVLEVWEVKGIWSTQLQAPTLLEHKMLSLEREMSQIKSRLDQLERGK